MRKLLSDVDSVLCLMDDVLVFGKDESERNDRIAAELQRIESAGVTLSFSKSEIR